ncbi:MAG: hypothetical protein HDS41_05520 [Bacteroides sp.]|nr:hypothetical protein [Bacteroides sp.]
MNGIFKKTAAFLLSLALVAPVVSAQRRATSGHRDGSKSEQVSPNRGSGSANKPQSARPAASRPASARPSGTSSRPGANGNHNASAARPGNNGNHNTSTARPGNNGNHNTSAVRPGNNGNHNGGAVNRPGNNGNHSGGAVNRPTTGNRHPDFNNRPVAGVRPGNNVRPPQNNAVRPRPDYRPPYVQRPPVHVHRPVPRPWHRPMPPAAWRPRPGAPLISAIFGLNFGTALNVSLSFLTGNGYTVTGYGNNAVYLSDVNQYNYYWPEATMYYGNNGLERTEFFYSTAYPDTMRYNSLYGSLTSLYGSPVNVSNVSSSLSATWFAPNKGYVTLQYVPQYSSGQLRFFTTITTGL